MLFRSLKTGAILASGVWVVASGQRNDAGLADARIAQLERQVADLASRVPADPANAASGSDLANRLQRLEAEIAAAPVPDPASASRIAAIETQLKTLGATVGALGQRGESTAAANASALSEIGRASCRERVSYHV